MRVPPARDHSGRPRLVRALCGQEAGDTSHGSRPMTLALGCIADDYTGASDLANTLTRCGLRTVQTIGVPRDDLALPEVDAVVVSLKSRSIEASKAAALAHAADQWLRSRGAGHVLFKICSTFDSTDAGNIGPVTDALRADADDSIVIVTPAFPETGRTVYQGNLCVGSRPRTRAGAGELRPGDACERSRGGRRKRCRRPRGLPRGKLLAGDARPDCNRRPGDAGVAARAREARHRLGGGRTGPLSWALERLGSGPVLIASSASPEAATALPARHGPDAIGHASEQAMAWIASGLC